MSDTEMVAQHLMSCDGIDWHKYRQASGIQSINFYVPKEIQGWNVKGLDHRLRRCSPRQFGVILDAYANSDGCFNGRGVIIYSGKEREIDLLQEIAVQSGFSATKHGRVRQESSFSKKEQWQLLVYPREVANYTEINDRVELEQVQSERFWCIRCDNQNFFMRRVGKVHLTGNCHGSLVQTRDIKRMDIGIDNHPQFRPFSFDEVKEILDKRGYEPVDGHKRKK